MPGVRSETVRRLNGRGYQHFVTSDVDVTFPGFPRSLKATMMSNLSLFKISQEAE
jgi:hypothetical protein